MTIELENGRLVDAEYVRHLRTLTSGSGCASGGNMDLDLFRLEDGTEVTCLSPSNNCRVTPWQITDANFNSDLLH